MNWRCTVVLLFPPLANACASKNQPMWVIDRHEHIFSLSKKKRICISKAPSHQKYVPSLKLTYLLKMNGWNDWILLGFGPICRAYVTQRFQGVNPTWRSSGPKPKALRSLPCQRAVVSWTASYYWKVIHEPMIQRTQIPYDMWSHVWSCPDVWKCFFFFFSKIVEVFFSFPNPGRGWWYN